jgi:hypothetical protein
MAAWQNSTLQNMSSKNSLLFAAGLFLLGSCNNDPKTESPKLEKSHLIGRWEIDKGFRNGRETETLTGTYYEFDDEVMKTNLTPTTMEQTYEYSFSGKTIKQKGEPQIVYAIDSLTPNFLAIGMTINNVPFDIHLRKAQPPAALEASDSSNQDSLKEL